MAYFIVSGPPLSEVERVTNDTDGVDMQFSLETEMKKYIGTKTIHVKRAIRLGSLYEIQYVKIVQHKPVTQRLYYNPHPDCDANSPNRRGWTAQK